MAKIIERSNSAYEERDEIQHKLAALKILHEKVTNQYEEKFKEFDSIIKKDEEINEKIKIKEKQRKDEEFKKLSSLEDSENKKSTQKAKQNFNASKVKEYKEMIQKIEQSTDLKIEELIKKFQDSEDQNFSLFTYVDELNNEIEKLEKQISELENEINQFKGDGETSEQQRKKLVTELQEQVNEIQASAEIYEEKYKTTLNVLKTLCYLIQTIFQQIGCDSKLIVENLGTNVVSESNLMVFLGLIEQKSNELLQLYILKKTEEHSEINIQPETYITMGPTHPFGSTKINVLPPSTSTGFIFYYFF
jgi:coiled-coil domain-containing protein 63/114